MVYKTGEKPGKGTYLCTKCDQKVTLDDATDTLPPCPKCKNTEFIKLQINSTLPLVEGHFHFIN